MHVGQIGNPFWGLSDADKSALVNRCEIIRVFDTKKRKVVKAGFISVASGFNYSCIYPAGEILALKRKFGFRCACCGVSEVEMGKRLQIDHIVPRSRGGSDSVENFQPLCKLCNQRKQRKEIDYRASPHDLCVRDAGIDSNGLPPVLTFFEFFPLLRPVVRWTVVDPSEQFEILGHDVDWRNEPVPLISSGRMKKG